MTKKTSAGLFLFSFLIALNAARGQSSANTGSSPAALINYAPLQIISNGDSSQTIVEKAAKVLPSPNQTDWMRLERTFFVHFGVNTFNGVEWGTGREDPSIFNPTSLDANQWVSAMKNAGGKLIVLVCKHHDGFCMWPTRYTAHSVAASPWLDGKGDEVRAVANAARAQGIKLGVYLSPADLFQLRTNTKYPGGYYGDGSSNALSVLPTDPANFKTHPASGRTPAAGFSSYHYEVDDYNRYFLNQLYELLTQYGPIAEVWFDGANPDRNVKETYDYAAWYDLIRRLQPQAIISCKGPDVRWVGNENGVGRATEWSVVPLPAPPDTYIWPDMTARDLGSRAKLAPGPYLWWYPAEVNVPILNGWFWAANKRPRSLPQLIDIFYSSVGRNGNLLLNLSPDKRGLIPDNQLAALSGMAQVVNDTFATDLAVGGQLIADNSNDKNSASLALDGNLDSWWEAAPGHTNATLTLTLPKAVTFDVVSLQEAVDHRSQRIESFAIDTWNGSDWVVADQQTTVGRRRLLRLNAPVTTSQVRIRITGSRLEPTLAELGLFKQAVTIASPTISEREKSASVTLTNNYGYPMVFTVDGTTPKTNSAVYKAPIALPLGGTVQAACLTPQGRLGMAASKSFAGLSPIGWKVVKTDSEERASSGHSAVNAIDGDPDSFWLTARDAKAESPHYVTIDMQKATRVNGLVYLPRQDGTLDGVVEDFRFETSLNGRRWTTNIASGTFGNIRNNPTLQEVTFPAVNARYFRFTSLREVTTNGLASAAEISVLPASRDGGN